MEMRSMRPSTAFAVRFDHHALLVALAAVTFALCALFGAAPAYAVTSSEAIRLLNVQRGSNGLPGGLVEDSYKSAGCENHDNYMALNGFGHGEGPSNQGYTTSGADDGTEVLSTAESPPWSDSSNPWITAPIHLYLMYRPQNTDAGYAYGHGFACMRLGGGRPDPPSPQFYSYPGNGLVGVSPSEHAEESPYVPQKLVGISPAHTTGPNILLFSQGFGDGLQVISASLTGPSGPVDIHTVQEDTSNSEGDGSWFAGGGVMIPVDPPAPGAAYHGTVSWRNQGGAQATQSFDFQTARTCHTKSRTHRHRHVHRLVRRDRHGHRRVYRRVHWHRHTHHRRVCTP